MSLAKEELETILGGLGNCLSIEVGNLGLERSHDLTSRLTCLPRTFANAACCERKLAIEFFPVLKLLTTMYRPVCTFLFNFRTPEHHLILKG